MFLSAVLEELEGGQLSSNLLSIHNVELGSSFKSLELDTDSSRGSMESLDSIASSITDEQSLEKVRKNTLGGESFIRFCQRKRKRILEMECLFYELLLT